MGFEENLQKTIFSQAGEKTFIDKLLGKEDVQGIRELIKKPRLTREDLLEILYMLSSNESKLLNLGEWDRYVLLKYFVWIREFVKIAELSFDYQDDLKAKTKLCKNCNGHKIGTKEKKKCKCKVFVPVLHISKRTERLLFNNQRLIEHNAKFLIDLYFNIGRTSLSLGGTAFMEILKNKYEVKYDYPVTPSQPEKKPSIFMRKE